MINDDTVDSVENVDEKATVVLGKNDDSVNDIVVGSPVKSMIVDCCISVVEMDSESLMFNDDPVDSVDIVDNKTIVVLGENDDAVVGFVVKSIIVDCCISVVGMDSGSLIFNDEPVDSVDNVDNKAIVDVGSNDDSVMDIEVFSVNKLMREDCCISVVEMDKGSLMFNDEPVDSVENVENKPVVVLGKINDSVKDTLVGSVNISTTVDSFISVVEMVSGSLIINDEPVDSVENVENRVIGDDDGTVKDIVVGSVVKSVTTDCCISVEFTVVGVHTVLVVSTVVVRVIIGSIMILGVVRKGLAII